MKSNCGNNKYNDTNGACDLPIHRVCEKVWDEEDERPNCYEGDGFLFCGFHLYGKLCAAILAGHLSIRMGLSSPNQMV